MENKEQQTNVEQVNTTAMTLDENIKSIMNSDDFRYDRRYQYMSGGKLFQTVAKLPMTGNMKRPVFVSVCINHTPRSKYTGEMLKKLRKEKGVGVIKNG